MPPQAQADLSHEGLLHDLNGVFQTVLDCARILGSDPKWAAVSASLARSVERGRRILGGAGAAAVPSASLEAVLDSAIEFTRDFFLAVNGPRVEFRRLTEAGMRLPGSSGEWERVFFNLFINAGQAMKQSGVVEVRAVRTEAGASIAVADNGAGIPGDALPHIFQPRFSTRPAGSGLGLHIVKSIVVRNGGTVSAANRETGPGAEFRIFLPGSGQAAGSR